MSIAFTLDGDYFKNPKFQHMVNGGTKEFPENGWHAMYDVSASIDDDRIYSLNIDFELLRAHAAQAAKAWTTQRQWFNNTWRPNMM